MNLTNWFKDQIGTAENPKGSNNIIYNTDYYGSEVYGDAYPWCVSFLWAGFKACNASKLFMGGGKTASVSALADWAQAHGQWVTGNYREGDLLCYGSAHAGYCLRNNLDGTVTAVEGNYSDKVSRVTRRVSEISGAYRPLYGIDPGVNPDIPIEPIYPDIPVQPDPIPNPLPPLPEYDFQPGDIVRINPGAAYWDGTRIPAWVFNHNWIIKSVYAERAVINMDEERFYRIMSAISVRYLTLVKTAAEAAVEAASVTEYRAQPGDTLWGIAQRFLDNGNKYKLIMRENNMTDTVIYPGQIIKLPKAR